MGRGNVATLAREGADEARGDDEEERADKPTVVVERNGFNLHAGVRIEAGDDLGRERLARYGARPPLSLERLRRLPGGRVAYRLKYVGRGRGKHRVMTPMEFMARLAAIICPPRYPLVRYAGVLGPRSAWRKDVVPKPRERTGQCDPPTVEVPPHRSDESPPTTIRSNRPHAVSDAPSSADRPASPGAGVDASERSTASIRPLAPAASEVQLLSPNIISVRHWERLLGGALYAATPRVDWATLLRRSFAVDVLECPKCHGRLRVIAVITERDPVQRILAHLGMSAAAPCLARARDPTDDADDREASAQLALGLS